MVRLAHTLCIAILTAHLTVGCCASYAQRCRGMRVSGMAQGDAGIEGRCAECRCDHSQQFPKKCQHSKRPAPSRRQKGGSAGPQFSASLAAMPDGCLLRRTLGLHRQTSAPGLRLPSVRLHLAKQVLLI